MSVNISLDLGSLSVYETSPLEIDTRKLDNYVKQVTEKCYHALMAELAKIRSEAEQINSVRKLEHQVKDFSADPNTVSLPAATTLLPRFHKPPKKPLMTRWEQFAKSKGIKKKKRSRLVYSEEVKDWVPRHGKGSKAHIDDELDIIHEEKAGSSSNPFQEKKQERNLAKNRQELKELKNKAHRKKDEELDTQKISLDKSIKNVSYATASLGKFAKGGDKAKKQRQTTETKRREISVEQERNRNRDILKKIIKK